MQLFIQELTTRNLFATLAGVLCFLPALLLAAGTNGPPVMGLTGNTIGFVSPVILGLVYLLVNAEEFTHLRKSN